MALKVGDILKRLGLRGAIIRYGEQWKTQEIKDLEEDIRAFYQKYEPYLKREEDYPFEFNTDLNDVLQRHGPRLWPDGLHNEGSTFWLFPAGEIDEYPEDICFSRHFEKIQPLFATLLAMRVKVYRSNQRHAELKAREKREAEVAAAANTITLDHPLSDSDLTDFDSHDELPSLVHAIKFTTEDGKAKVQEILKGEEFNLRKRKVATDSPSKSIKRPRKSTVPVEPFEPVEPVDQGYVQDISIWTTTNPESTHVASPPRLDNGHELLVAAASGRSHGFVSVNQTEQTEHNVHPMPPVQSGPEVPDSYDVMNPHMSNSSSPNNENHNLPETPGEGALLHTQYSLPQDKETSLSAQHVHDHQRALPEVFEPSSQPQTSDKFIPWPKINKRRAKRSKTALRPMLNDDDMELSAQDAQSMTELPSRPSSGPSDLPPQQEAPLASPALVDDSESSRKLMRRTHVRTPAAEPNVATFTPVSTQKRSYQTPYAHPPLSTPQSVSTSAVLDATNPHPATLHSPLVASTPTIAHMPPSADTPLSAQLITNHFAQAFVKFTLPLPNGRSANKMIKLTDCSDAFALHQAVIHRFKHALAGQIPSEIVVTSANEDYEIEADECGQHTWNEFMQTVVDTAPPGTCPIVALVRV
ncbi:hypothetical protein M436DRAFT_81901 [Aureobasidium namibiae CBS 147.97]|uniref:Uncharacterized protein n=1 Tax=Aureobasidium namibiae CBS 147.97 TaxID=1043004 RepID=A0A074WK69_9PEZI